MTNEAEQHVAKWRTFRSVAEVLATSPAPISHWAVVARFYAALHLLEAYLRTKDVRFFATSHADRKRAMRSAPELKPLFAAYEVLQGLAEHLRYQLAALSPTADGDTAAGLAKVEQILRPKLKGKGIDAEPHT